MPEIDEFTEVVREHQAGLRHLIRSLGVRSGSFFSERGSSWPTACGANPSTTPADACTRHRRDQR
jgi:hypothetical protein